MIPIKMWFSGIRDYDPSTMDLSGRTDHVLITGPNGAGKSTITYCMGAVLYSSKVELDGLRSRNLATDEAWKAQIRLLFKNEGRVRIDAPDYIEFAINIYQEPGPGQPIKKEFVISSGDAPEQWEEQTHYTSGDRQYNFTAYKKDLQYKYKIDPDMFYLIWYQQEVNQFAVMNPEERFRIFAEMHGIDQVQRNWEESVEKLGETQEMLRVAESNVASKKQWLKIKKKELDLYEDNQRRLLEGGRLYIASLLKLESYYKDQQEQLLGQINQLTLDREQQQDSIAEASQKETLISNGIAERRKEQEQLTETLMQYEKDLQRIEYDRDSCNVEIEKLRVELQEVSKEKDRITRTEDEVHQQLRDNEARLNITIEKQHKLDTEVKRCEESRDDSMKKISKLEAELELERKQEVIHQERLEQYGSSHQIQAEIDRLEQLLRDDKDTNHEASNRIRELKEELASLDNEQDWTRRQKASLSFFRANRITAYTLRELIELDDSAKLKAEEKFNAIKYTVFFDGHTALPINDLYHVPLKKLVPDRSFTELPELQLRVKQGLPSEVMPHAMKALWWLEQFFKNGEIRIENGVLIDSIGIRGAQEDHRYILSARALSLRKQEITKEITLLTTKCAELEDSINRNTKRLQELNSVIQSVREAEAFMTKQYERASKSKQLQEQLLALEQLKSTITEFKAAQVELYQSRYQLEQTIKELQKEAEFYVRLGQQKEKFELLNAKEKQLQHINAEHGVVSKQLDDCENGVDKLERELRKRERELGDVKYAQESEERELERINKQLQSRQESLDTIKGEFVSTIKELEELKVIISEVYHEVINELALDNASSAPVHSTLTISAIRAELERGRTQFNHARYESDIDPAAPENYKIIEEEYSRLQDEFKRTSVLVQQDQQRTEQLKDQLETTTNMRVLELQQRFKSYMSSFQFEGVIEWDQYEDRRGRTHFNLFIKARKEGHRGSLEDVSTKARGGKVGKGVSGGEESLSSLLFALALLQNLQTAPGFIVLDEFDSALDEQRKLKVFDLYRQELERKLIILTPKSHESSYLDRYSKAYIVHHDPTIPRSKVTGIRKKS